MGHPIWSGLDPSDRRAARGRPGCGPHPRFGRDVAAVDRRRPARLAAEKSADPARAQGR